MFREKPVWSVGGDWDCLNTEDDLEQAVTYASEAQDRTGGRNRGQRPAANGLSGYHVIRISRGALAPVGDALQVRHSLSTSCDSIRVAVCVSPFWSNWSAWHAPSSSRWNFNVASTAM